MALQEFEIIQFQNADRRVRAAPGYRDVMYDTSTYWEQGPGKQHVCVPNMALYVKPVPTVVLCRFNAFLRVLHPCPCLKIVV